MTFLHCYLIFSILKMWQLFLTVELDLWWFLAVWNPNQYQFNYWTPFYLLNSGQVQYRNHLNTQLVWHLYGKFVSISQMVRYSNGGQKTGLKKPVYGPKCPVFEQSVKSCDFTIWIPDTHTVWYSDESGIQVFSIQMVTVFGFPLHNI